MAIPRNELRIGNWICDIHTNNAMWPVTSIRDTICHYGGYRAKYKDLMPVPLTRDLLARFGFKKRFDTQVCNIYDAEIVSVAIFKNGQFGILNCPCCKQLNYVHEFQNAMFYLTQTELELKFW